MDLAGIELLYHRGNHVQHLGISGRLSEIHVLTRIGLLGRLQETRFILMRWDKVAGRKAFFIARAACLGPKVRRLQRPSRSRVRSTLLKPDEPAHVVGQIGETDLHAGTGDADGAHDETHEALLVREDVLDRRAYP